MAGFSFCQFVKASKYLHTNTHLNLTINRIVCIITHMADVPCFGLGEVIE
nr:MAG TPA: hypothetical protein [Caudoviricetes sp.]DAX43733.1 MAG TPA: hypothetical protein [Caudoviricetes sp.]